jgi:nicotinate phosphoribosyltransferase
LEQALNYLGNIRFREEHLAYLKIQGLKEDFLDYLKTFRFRGEVYAAPEGTIVFPDEPLIRVTAPIIEAQLIETFLLNTIDLQTTLATKASRAVTAAQGKSIIEFGLRRTQGTDAGMKAARCSYLAGCNGTSNVLAGMHYNIPVFGTMAHSYVMFHDTEQEAFETFARTFPENSTFLIDTYDDSAGAENAGIVAKQMEKQGHKLKAVRLDSGNLVVISRKVRAILDEHGLDYVKIFASGDLDEYKVASLIKNGARIDSFGVGTRMSTSNDRPYVDVVYKLSGREENGIFVPAMKLSKDKITLPGKKQVFRQTDSKGNYARDIIALEHEEIQGEPLMQKVMEKGNISCDQPSLEQIRIIALNNLSRLPNRYKRLRNAPKYPVALSPELKRIKTRLTEELKKIEHST